MSSYASPARRGGLVTTFIVILVRIILKTLFSLWGDVIHTSRSYVSHPVCLWSTNGICNVFVGGSSAERRLSRVRELRRWWDHLGCCSLTSVATAAATLTGLGAARAKDATVAMYTRLSFMMEGEGISIGTVTCPEIGKSSRKLGELIWTTDSRNMLQLRDLEPRRLWTHLALADTIPAPPPTTTPLRVDHDDPWLGCRILTTASGR